MTAPDSEPEGGMTSIFAPALMQGKSCIITGGGTGIGFATARQLVRAGARVALFGRREEVLNQAAERLSSQLSLDDKSRDDKSRVVTARCDIREPESVEKAVAWARERLGPIHVLVNNAGGQFPSPAEGISSKGFEAVVRNNLLGTWNMTREVAIRTMIPDGGGSIVNVIANIERGFPGMVHTGAARAGVENMTRTLAIEWTAHHIRVNAVAPGIIRTEGIAQYPDEIRDLAIRNTPARRFGTADEVANVITFLCSERAASFMTGATIYVDGGARLWGETWPMP